MLYLNITLSILEYICDHKYSSKQFKSDRLSRSKGDQTDKTRLQLQRKATNQLMKSILLKFKVVKVFPNKVLMAPNRPRKSVVEIDQIVFVSI